MTPTASLDTYILSAQYGLLAADSPIEAYDQRLTPWRVRELTPEVESTLREIVRRREYRSLCLHMGNEYQRTLGAWRRMLSDAVTALICSGPPGTRLAQLRDWLYHGTPPGEHASTMHRPAEALQT
jgi:hypothetical protein